MIANIIRKEAETDVPTIPPTLLKVPNLELIADAVPATAMEMIMTTLQMSERGQISESWDTLPDS